MPLTAGLLHTQIADQQGYLTPPWATFFRDAEAAAATVPSRILTAQVTRTATAAIPATPLGIGSRPAGLFRVTAYVRVLTPATVSSSVAVSVSWKDGGIACALVLVPPVTGNVPTAVGTGTALLHLEAGSPLTYATTYASDAAGGMGYALHLVVEDLGGP